MYNNVEMINNMQNMQKNIKIMQVCIICSWNVWDIRKAMEDSTRKREDVIEEILNTIEECIKERNLKQKDILKLCEKKGYNITQSELSRILSHKIILGLYPAIALSDVLDIDISAVLYPSRWRRRKWDISSKDFILDTENIAIKHFIGEYHIIFHSTDYQENKILQGRMLLYPQKGEDGSRYCAALMSLDTGEKDEQGESILKKYEGQFFVSSLGVAYCILINNEWKEMSLITFRHRTFYLKKVKCRLGLAMTISAGEKKQPVVHKLAIYREEYNLTKEQKHKIINILKIQKESDVYLSPEELMNDINEKISPNAKTVIKSIRTKLPVNEYYVVNKQILKSMNRKISYEEIEEILSGLNENEEEQFTMSLGEEEDKKLFDLFGTFENSI